MSTGDFAVGFGAPASAGMLERETSAPRYPSFTPSRSASLPGLLVGQRPDRPRQRDRHWSRTYVQLLMLTDAVIAFLALMAGWQVANVVGGSNEIPWQFMLLALVTWPLSIGVRRGYDPSRAGLGSSELHALPRALADHVVASALICVVLTNSTTLVTLMVAGTPVAVVAGSLARLAFRRHLQRRQRLGQLLRSVLVVGPRDASESLAETLSNDRAFGFKVLGACVPESEGDHSTPAMTVLGHLNEVPDIVTRLGCEAVAVTGGLAPTYLRGLTWSLEGRGVELLVHPGLVEVAGPRMHIRPFVGLPLLHVEQPHFTGWRRTVKRVFDFTVTAFGLLLVSPVLLVLMAMIKLSDRGPVFFTQTRVGLDGKTFQMIKFRSMVVNAEALKADLMTSNEGAGPLFKMKDDPRITRIGRVLRRYSIDELPQLFNVLRGEMSLVGPRPPLPSEVDQYGNDVRRRLLVKPGLTGLWQVSGRSMLSWDESVRLDLRYVENWSLTFDLLIIWKTARAVIGRDGAY